ncbi:hypothetical protein FOPE_01487 [Fonsecaea pedrosoi]|nr:hypothetical protein FOPE_01487 [Fonsecaea pedrosoi]
MRQNHLTRVISLGIFIHIFLLRNGISFLAPVAGKDSQDRMFSSGITKLKCDRDHPCATCAKVNAVCKYPEESKEQPQSEEVHRPNGSPQDAPAMESVAGPVNYGGSLAPCASTQSVDAMESEQAHGALGVDRQYPPFQDPFADPFGSLPLFDVSNGLDFAQIGVDWLDVSEDLTGDWGISEPMAANEDGPSNRQQSPCLDRSAEMAPLTTRTARASPQIYQPGLATPSVTDLAPEDHDVSRQQWPFDAERDAAPKRYQAPPMRQVLQMQIQTSNKEYTSFHNSLTELFSDTYLPIPEVDRGTVAAMQVVKRWLESYFREFHGVSPVIHTPTWDIETCPTILIAAMSLIGAASSARDGPSRAQLAVLSELCSKMLPLIAASDTKNYQDINYLIAYCLSSIYYLGSGDRQLYQVADRSRGILIGSLRGLGILRSYFSVSVEGEKEKGDQYTDHRDRNARLHQDWISWRDQQQELRLAWTVFGFDYTLSTLTSKRGGIDLSELPTRLPCADSLWTAPSAQAWAALKVDMSETATGASLAFCLRSIVAGKQLPPDLPPYSRRYCTTVLDRLLWDLKQLDMVFMTGCLGLPQSSSGQQERKTTLLEILGKIRHSLSRPRSNEELINYSMIYSIYHYSNLSNSGDMMDLVVFIARKSLSANNPHAMASINAAERRLAISYASDPQKTRSLVWHAAQIIGVSNHYIFCSPCEVLRMFAAYAVLIAYGRYRPRLPPDYRDTTPIDIGQIYANAEQMAATTQWIRYGGCASVGSAKDIRSEEGVRALIREGCERLSSIITWRASGMFVRALKYFELEAQFEREHINP